MWIKQTRNKKKTVHYAKFWIATASNSNKWKTGKMHMNKNKKKTGSLYRLLLFVLFFFLKIKVWFFSTKMTRKCFLCLSSWWPREKEKEQKRSHDCCIMCVCVCLCAFAMLALCLPFYISLTLALFLCLSMWLCSRDYIYLWLYFINIKYFFLSM